MARGPAGGGMAAGGRSVRRMKIAGAFVPRRGGWRRIGAMLVAVGWLVGGGPPPPPHPPNPGGGRAAGAARAAAAPTAAPQPVHLEVNWTAVSGSQSGLWMAYEAGAFQEQALDVELINIASTSRAIQAMVA